MTDRQLEVIAKAIWLADDMKDAGSWDELRLDNDDSPHGGQEPYFALAQAAIDAIYACNSRSLLWHPIETAPKDGAKVDLWFPRSGRQTDCWYENGKWLMYCGRDRLGEAGDYIQELPTHWMLPPEPPK
jgi:hypothetical protein